MEWRLFVPIIDESRPELQQIYSEIDHLFQQFIPDQEEESRSDSYFVTSHEFGVKYRHGKKLELKVKSKTSSSLGIELWTKSKLGKSEIDLQIDNVLDHLGRSGYQEEQAKFRSIIQRKKTVEVVKSRKVGFINPVSVEYCKLSARGQRWVSVAVESYSAEEIARFLSSHDLIHQLFALISRFYAITRPIEGRERSVHVVLGGYPFWVQYIDGSHEGSDLVHSNTILREIFSLKGLDNTIL